MFLLLMHVSVCTGPKWPPAALRDAGAIGRNLRGYGEGGVTPPKILETAIGRAIRGIGRAIVFMILLINIYF